ncbi:MAG: CapA family protein [Halobacteriales archaeon]|nr:CapA family protein [Halobacteriales archaeon]
MSKHNHEHIDAFVEKNWYVLIVRLGMRLGFTGDVMLGRKVNEFQQLRDPERVWGSVRELLDNLDALFINLECVLSTRGTQWTRTRRPFHFRADPDWAVPALGDAGTDFAALANNHMLDFETVALHDTLAALDSVGIAHAGAGENEQQACAPAIITVDGIRVAVVAFTDNTPEYAAGPESAGVARIEMEMSDTDRTLVTETLKRAYEHDPDLLVASLHWGPNMVAIPDEQYRVFGRWLVEQGVDIVHGHSAHVFQGIERHKGGIIFYDTGDFIDDYAIDRELRNDRSFLFAVEVTAAGELEAVTLYPVEIDRCTVHEADEEVAAWCRETMRERSEPFGTADAYEQVGDSLRLAL